MGRASSIVHDGRMGWLVLLWVLPGAALLSALSASEHVDRWHSKLDELELEAEQLRHDAAAARAARHDQAHDD